MNFLRSYYGKIHIADQASLEARRKTRQRVSIVAISSVILLAIVILVVTGTANRNSDTESTSSNPNTPSTSIKAVCTSTLYPDSCLSTLSPLDNSTRIDPVQLFHVSVQAAINELAKASRSLKDVGVNLDKISLRALSDCGDLIGLAIDHLNDSISSSDFSSEGLIDDIKTWVSAAITYEHTCIDGFANAAEEVKATVAKSMKNSTEFTSNSLAILTEVSDFMSSIKFRRLMSHSNSHGSPSWASHEDRRLLESTWDQLRKNANVVVAKDGSGKYTTISAAITKAPEKSEKRFVIYVKKGIYYENVKVDSKKWNVVMVGDGMDATIVSGSLNFVDGTPTYSTATFAVFGKGFMARDMGFLNTAGPQKHQAVALLSDSDRSIVYRCRFDAFQDTLYAHSLRQFYSECNIYGTVDFIFGNTASVFRSCNILPRVPMPGQQDTITAQGKIDPNQNTGISIYNCTVWPHGDLKAVDVYLGRPWKLYSTTVFVRTMMAGFINSAGWMPWNGSIGLDTLYYSEYQNFGPGAVTKGRVKWKGLRSMNTQQAAKFAVGGFLGGCSWISKAGVPCSHGF